MNLREHLAAEEPHFWQLAETKSRVNTGLTFITWTETWLQVHQTIFKGDYLWMLCVQLVSTAPKVPKNLWEQVTIEFPELLSSFGQKRPISESVLLHWPHRPLISVVLKYVETSLHQLLLVFRLHIFKWLKGPAEQSFIQTFDPESPAVITTQAQKLLERFNLTCFHCSNKQSGWCQTQKILLNNWSIIEANTHDETWWSDRTRGPSLLQTLWWL